MKKGWLRQATEALEESRTANPDFLATHFNLALSYHQQGRYDEAIAEHREVLRINPRHAASHGDLGRIYMETGEPELALKELNRALTIQPDLAPALIDRAGLLILQGRYEEAEQDIRQLTSLGADTGELREKLLDAREMRQGPPSD
jgi:tetratricopeptide (TPR) repeat protein